MRYGCLWAQRGWRLSCAQCFPLALPSSGLIDKSEFQEALGLKRNLFVDRMFELFDANGDPTSQTAPRPGAAC